MFYTTICAPLDHIVHDFAPFSSGADSIYSGLHLSSSTIHDELLAARKRNFRNFLIKYEEKFLPVTQHWKDKLAQDFDLNKLEICIPYNSDEDFQIPNKLAELRLDELHIRLTPPEAGHDITDMYSDCARILYAYFDNRRRQNRLVTLYKPRRSNRKQKPLPCNVKRLKISYDLDAGERAELNHDWEVRFKSERRNSRPIWGTTYTESFTKGRRSGVFTLEDPDRWTKIPAYSVMKLVDTHEDDAYEFRKEFVFKRWKSGSGTGNTKCGTVEVQRRLK